MHVSLVAFVFLAMMASSSKGCTSKINTVEKWIETLNADWLEYENDGQVVNSLRCKVCRNKEDRITSAKNFSRTFITGSAVVKKNAVVNHMNSELPFKKYIPICKLLEKGGVDLG